MLTEGPRERRKWAPRAVAFAMVAVIAAASGWAIATVLDEPDEVLDSSPFTYVEVVEGEVGSSLNLSTTAEWTPLPLGVTQGSGTVTTISIEAGQEVDAGSVLFTINLRPVVIAQGSVPSFRPLAAGMSGSDVTQLQQLLTALGLFSGTTDGVFGAGTESAVRAWQRSLGVQVSGVVEPGDLIFVPTLPTTVALDTAAITPGATVAPGLAVLLALPESPQFSIPITDQQTTLLPAGTRVEITSPSGEIWEGFAGDQRTDETGAIRVSVAGRDGANVCADACAEIPIDGPTVLISRVITVESVSGLSVPSAAIATDASGATTVIDADGNSQPITIIASARGMSIVDGVDVGIRVRVPAMVD